MKKVLYVVIAICFIGLIGKTAWNMHQQYNGVCLEIDRPLTDAEKFRLVIKQLNRSSKRSVKVGNSYVAYDRVPYTSVDEFLDKNPDCCSVEVKKFRNPPRGETYDFARTLGLYAGHVTVNYTLNYLDENEVEQQIQDKLIYTIQNCGAVD